MSIQANHLTFGCDPELFIRNILTRTYVSAHDIIPGDKKNPYKVKGGAIQSDGVAAEFNIDPVQDKSAWSDSIWKLRKILDNFSKLKAPSIYPTVESSVLFEKDYFNSLPEEVKAVGCDPDFDAYDEDMNLSPDLPTDNGNFFRFGGGHIHVGWDEGLFVGDESHFFDCIQVTKQLDMMLYELSPLWDTDLIRRSYYGKQGTFRVKPYGVEYRTLSNAWLKYPTLITWIYDATKLAMEILDQGTRLDTLPELFEASSIGKERPLTTEEVFQYEELLCELTGLGKVSPRIARMRSTR